MAAIILEHTNQPVIKAADLQDRHERLTALQALTRQPLEKGVDFLRLRRYLSGLQNIPAFIAERNRDLPCMLIDSEVQHSWFSCWGKNGSANFNLPDRRTASSQSPLF